MSSEKQDSSQNRALHAPKVIVCGAGIGGLTVAHELAKRGFEITVYERNEIIGGLARSKYHKEGPDTYPVEYSWRVYGSGYHNLLRLLHEIPLRRGHSGRVYDNLVQIWAYIFPRFDKSEVILGKGRKKNATSFDFSLKEQFAVFEKLATCLTMSRSRMDSLDHLRWKDFCNDLTPEAQKYMVRLWGPVLGMDPSHMSFSVIARMVGGLLEGYTNTTGTLFVMNQPTNDGWFDEWADFLQKTGKVVIRKNCEITNFKIEDGLVREISVTDRETQESFTDRADDYVCALPVEAVAQIVSQNPSLSGYPTLKNAGPLANISRQIQLSVQIFLKEKILYPSQDAPILYLPDSPWAIIIEPQDMAWGKTFCSNPNVKSVLSVGICQTDAPGILHKKPFTKCTKKEIQEEVWAQIKRSCRHTDLKLEDGRKLEEAEILLFYIWDSFSFDPEKREITTWEPKFSNNAGALQYQPETTTEISNLLFATGYTKTDRFIYSMESAAEAGTRCANALLRTHGFQEAPTRVFPTPASTAILRPLIGLDWLLYKLGLPHLGKVLFSSLVMILLYFILAASLLWTLATLLVRAFMHP